MGMKTSKALPPLCQARGTDQTSSTDELSPQQELKIDDVLLSKLSKPSILNTKQALDIYFFLFSPECSLHS